MAQVGVVGVVGVAVVAQMDLKVQAIVKYYQSCSKLRVHVSVVPLCCVSMRQDVLQCNSTLDCWGSLVPMQALPECKYVSQGEPGIFSM